MKPLILLPLLFAVGCSSSNNFPASKIHSHKIKAHLKTSPVGDSTHREIYTFIGDEISKYAHEDRGEALSVLENEKRALQTSGIDQIKPTSASFYEGPFSGILHRLCSTHSGCVSLGIYTKSGRGISLTGKGLPSALTKKDGWATLKQKGKNPLMEPLTSLDEKALGVDMSNKLISVTHRVYQRTGMDIPYSLSPDHKDAKLIGFVRTVMDMTKIKIPSDGT